MTPEIQELTVLKLRKDNLEVELKEVKLAIEELQPIVLQQFQQSGTNTWSGNGCTLYLRQTFKVWPRESNEAVIDALIASGYDDIVVPSYHRSKLTALVRELDEQISPELRAVLEIRDDFDVIVRKS